MNLQFLGAARHVTGSQYYLESNGTKILVDCGMFQEREFLGRNWEPSPIPAKDLDAILLTHAHVDHCGLVPKLVKEGFRGEIIATPPSVELVELVLRDSAEIQAEDAAYKRKRHKKEGRQGKYPVEPLYTLRDVEHTVALLSPAAYEQSTKISDDVSVILHDAGHILGSAIVDLKIRENGHSRRVVFSGDLGQWGKPIIRDPTVLSQADVVVMESTYGARNHENHDDEDVPTQMANVINRTAAEGGNVVVPIFAIERAQEFLYYLSQLLHAGRIPALPVFLDSPMAADATAVFTRHPDCFDIETWQMIGAGNSPFSFPGLKTIRTTDESKGVNTHKGPAIIMATSGMCTAGRIKFHLRQNILRPECTILFVGYQAQGTLGRQILDGDQDVRIHGRPYRVKARVDQIRGFSGHADRAGLMRWLGHLKTPPEQVFLVHGEEEQSLSLQDHIRQTLGWNVSVPQYRQVLHLA